MLSISSFFVVYRKIGSIFLTAVLSKLSFSFTFVLLPRLSENVICSPCICKKVISRDAYNFLNFLGANGAD